MEKESGLNVKAEALRIIALKLVDVLRSFMDKESLDRIVKEINNI